jgi:hypothetical protein
MKTKSEKYKEAVTRNLKSTNRKKPLPKNVEGARHVLGIRKGDDQFDTLVLQAIRTEAK